MKKVIRTMAAVAVLFATTTGMAKEPKLVTDGTSKSIVFEWETQPLGASLRILDTEGNIVYSDYLNKEGSYIKKFDLTPLISGAYFLKIDSKMKEIVYSITVNANSITILGMKENFKPTFRNKKGRLYLNYLNKDMEEVKIGVTDSFGNVLFEETMKNSFVVEKAFNFNEAVKGDYTITLNDGQNKFYETFKVKN